MEEFITDEPDFDVFSSAYARRYLVSQCCLHWRYLLIWCQMFRLWGSHALEEKCLVIITLN